MFISFKKVIAACYSIFQVYIIKVEEKCYCNERWLFIINSKDVISGLTQGIEPAFVVRTASIKKMTVKIHICVFRYDSSVRVWQRKRQARVAAQGPLP